MRAQWRFGIADRYGRLHDGGETLAHIDLALLLADENGDRRKAALGFLGHALGFGQRCTDLDEAALCFERPAPFGAVQRRVIERGLESLGRLSHLSLCRRLRTLRTLTLSRVSLCCEGFRAGTELGFGLRAR